ncbi:hypothetical protein [Commensalibacter papalotli (ex Servin-Garciduenas et al. 2014)]|uniref:Uncharacterized protein n=1 Tax=Commensalibacter papalotli (ex Servin-Garciduenas et al. 2014) TaxID=1208583 RepID=W7E807_9PROT|nr:hypothetical protein [Commensalibacter papalotli (ex Servin-Garciduenas et al. 2014)]EUK19276.1 hypothetical protein COMX_05980 [Commensalibacter papalotli (ex Servin-Garciduenas et al. 2014)]
MKIFTQIPLLGSYVAVTALVTGSMISFTHNARAADGKACYEQFSEAKKAGTLKEKNFKEYKAANCDAKQAKPTENAAVKEAKSASESPKEPAKKTAVEKAPVVTGDVVFPEKVDPKFANEKEGKARMMTCQEQYKANKVSNKNGGLKWIQKGGGYYSECNKHLKTSAK